jgi:hypothetical protein
MPERRNGSAGEPVTARELRTRCEADLLAVHLQPAEAVIDNGAGGRVDRPTPRPTQRRATRVPTWNLSDARASSTAIHGRSRLANPAGQMRLVIVGGSSMLTHLHTPSSFRSIARELGIAAVLLATIGLAPAITAADDAAFRSATAPAASEGRPMVETAEQRTAVGLVASIDNGRIALRRGAEPDLRLTVDGGTHVAVDGRTASLAELRSGQEVRASYQEANGVAKATQIEARSAQGAPVRTMSPDDPEWDQAHVGG